MGAYLSTPVTEKETASGNIGGMGWGVASMQGWRRSHEDAHAVVSLGKSTAMFGVFDGHCGREVAQFASRRLGAVIEKQPAFASDLGAAMRTAFLGVDELLEDTAHLPELESYKEGADGGGGAEGPAGGGGGGRRIPISDALSMLQSMVLARKTAAGRADGRGGGGAASGEGGGTVSAGGGNDDDDDGEKGEGTSDNAADQAARSELGENEADAGGAGDGSPSSRVCTLPNSHVMAGCTAVVASVRGSLLYVANAGDSRAVICTAGRAPRAVALSTDHKPALPGEARRIEAANGWVTSAGRINGNLNLSRAIGDLKYKQNKALPAAGQIISGEPDVLTHTLTADDEFLILACDGIWDCMTNQEVVDFIRERLPTIPLPEIASELFDKCIAPDPRASQGIGGDNMTALIVHFKPLPSPRTSASPFGMRSLSSLKGRMSLSKST